MFTGFAKSGFAVKSSLSLSCCAAEFRSNDVEFKFLIRFLNSLSRLVVFRVLLYEYAEFSRLCLLSQLPSLSPVWAFEFLVVRSEFIYRVCVFAEFCKVVFESNVTELCCSFSWLWTEFRVLVFIWY